MHSLGPSRVPVKPINSTSPSNKYSWDKPRATGTLESLVNQATTNFPYRKVSLHGGGDHELVRSSRLDKDNHRAVTVAASSSATMTMDALVPCSNNRFEDQTTTNVMESIPGAGGRLGSTTCVVGCSTRVGSCSGPADTQDDEILLTAGKRAGAARVPVTPEWSSKDQQISASSSATLEKDLGVGFTSTSPENTISSATARPQAIFFLSFFSIIIIITCSYTLI